MPQDYRSAIAAKGLTIYDKIEVGDPELWVPTSELERILDCALRGISLSGLALRTRSKVIKEHVCRALGYPVPKSFRKTQPRFVGQQFDTYAQKANNLQIWNEELSPTRRYVLVQIGKEDQITRVKVVNGAELARLDTTGTLTQKYQARLKPTNVYEELISERDTELLAPHTKSGATIAENIKPTDHPVDGLLLPISELFASLRDAVGCTFADAGIDQERNRGAALHRIVCKLLGYKQYLDSGSFPDVRNQLLEVKLQTSPTIDLGLVRPDSKEPLDVPKVAGSQIRHCDVRYGLFYGETNGVDITITHFFLTTGTSFFTRFPQFQGNILNKKLQIPLPSDFFEG